MTTTQGAAGNLINRYLAVLRKCHLMNVFGPLVVAGTLVFGGAGFAWANGGESPDPGAEVSSFQELKNALSGSGNEIHFTENITLDARLQNNTPVQRSITIDGGGYTLSGTHPGFWFKDMNSGTVSITNMTFDGLKNSPGERYEGPVTFGSAIFFDMGYFSDNWQSTAKLVIGDGVQFKNTKVEGDSPGIGGAIRTAHGIVEIGNNVSFTNCTGGDPSVGGAGGALYSESYTTIGDNVVFTGNTSLRGGAICAADDYQENPSDDRPSKYIKIGKNAQFINNKVISSIGGDGGAIEIQAGEVTIDDGSVFSGNSSDYTGGAISICNWFPLEGSLTVNSTSFTDNSAEYGGAIINSGTLTFMKSASFKGNKASSMGGAIYNESVIRFSPGATDEVLFEGNTDATGLNAIAMASGSSLYVSGSGKVIFNDPISFEDATPTVTKTGTSTLALNSSMNDFLGTVVIQNGIMTVTKDWDLKNTVTVSGTNSERGVLKLSSFSFSKEDTGKGIAGGKLILAGGTLQTNTGQIFTTALPLAGATDEAILKVTSAGSIKPDVTDSLDFQSGLIAFDDAKYNLAYARDAADRLGAADKTPQTGSATAPSSPSGANVKEITFTGTLVTAKPVVPPSPEPEPDTETSGKVTVDDIIKDNLSNVVLGNVTIATGSDETGKNLVIGVQDSSEIDDENFKDADTIKSSIGSRNLDIGKNGTGVMVTGGQYLTIVGYDVSTPLVHAGENKSEPVDMLLGGTFSGQQIPGVLNLGTPVMESGGTLNGKIQVGQDSILNVRSGEFSLTGNANTHSEINELSGLSNKGGTVNIYEGAQLNTSVSQSSGSTNVSGTLNAPHLRATGGTITVTGTVITEELQGSEGVTIRIGDGEHRGLVTADNTSMHGATGFLDPVWKGNDTLAEASQGVFQFRGNILDGRWGVGRNALLVLGDSSTAWAEAAFASSGLTWGKNAVSAALALRTPQTLDPVNGALMVDGTLSSAPSLTANTAFFADQSLLLLDVSNLNGSAALTAQGGTLNVASSASLVLDNVTKGDYIITSGFTHGTVSGWNNANLITPDAMLDLTLDTSTPGSTLVKASVRDAEKVFPGLGMHNSMNTIWHNKMNDLNSPNAGILFVSRASNERYLPKTKAIQTIDGAAQIAVAGGARNMAFVTANAPLKAIESHMALAGTVSEKGVAVQKHNLNLWLDALYGSESTRNFDAGSLSGGSSGNFGGVVFGGDTTCGNFRVGLSLNAGGGNSRSRGDFNETKNTLDFWGAHLYGGWRMDNLNIMAELGYTAGRHDLRQTLPYSMGLDQIKADVDTQVLSAGVRAEYKVVTGLADIVPHIGVHAYTLTTDAFTARINKLDALKIEKDMQHVWTFPVGVTARKEITTDSGWTVTPQIDLSVVPTTGDTRAKTRAGVVGVAASDTLNSRAFDSIMFDGLFGLEIHKENVSFGVNYRVEASEHRTGHGIAASFEYKF